MNPATAQAIAAELRLNRHALRAGTKLPKTAKEQPQELLRVRSKRRK